MDNLNNKDKKMPIQQKSEVKVKSPVLEKISVVVMMLGSIALAAGLLLPFLIPDKITTSIQTKIVPDDNSTSGESVRRIAGNPAAIYCTNLGYEYEITETEAGQDGICIFPDKSKCSEWDFYAGTCGEKYSYCEKNGYTVETKSDGDDPYALDYSVCIKDGQIAGTTLSLMGLKNIVEPEREINIEGEVQYLVAEEQSSVIESSVSGTEENPASFDWRDYEEQNWMTPIRAQSSCGSCWAFAANAVVEAVANIEAGNPNLDQDLSEMYLVSDCNPYYQPTYGWWNNCCGGWRYKALEFIRDYGVVDEACLPYVAYGCSCHFDSLPWSCTESDYCADNSSSNGGVGCASRTCANSCSDSNSRLHKVDAVYRLAGDPLNPTHREAIKQIIRTYGPVAVDMNLEGSIQSDNVYRCTDDTTDDVHDVAIVGWQDTGDGEGYWIMKNSWGLGGPFHNGYWYVGYGECAIDNIVYYVDNVSEPNLTCDENEHYAIRGGTDKDWLPNVPNNTDEACCENDACVFNGKCYPAGDSGMQSRIYNVIDGANQQLACSNWMNDHHSYWLNLDFSREVCEAGGHAWNVGQGDANSESSYASDYTFDHSSEYCQYNLDNGGTPSTSCCCGDDTNEYVITNENGQTACCSSADAYLGDDGQCQYPAGPDTSCEANGGQCVYAVQGQCVGIDNVVLENYIPSEEYSCSGNYNCCVPEATGGID